MIRLESVYGLLKALTALINHSGITLVWLFKMTGIWSFTISGREKCAGLALDLSQVEFQSQSQVGSESYLMAQRFMNGNFH